MLSIFTCSNVGSYRFPWLMGLPLELQLTWVGARSPGCCCIHPGICSWWACSRDLSGGGLHLVPGWIGLPLGPCLVQLRLGQASTSGSAIGSANSACYQVCGQILLLQVPGRAPTGSLAGSLCRQAGSRLLVPGAGNKSQGCFRFHSLDWGLFFDSGGRDGQVSHQILGWWDYLWTVIKRDWSWVRVTSLGL